MTKADQAARARDARVTGARAAELHAWGVPCGWIVVSPVECQALLDGIVPTEILKQAATLLRPDVEGRSDASTDDAG